VKSQKATRPGVFVTTAMRSWTDSAAEREREASSRAEVNRSMEGMKAEGVLRPEYRVSSMEYGVR
jgi:hypothetical protein